MCLDIYVRIEDVLRSDAVELLLENLWGEMKWG